MEILVIILIAINAFIAGAHLSHDNIWIGAFALLTCIFLITVVVTL